MVPPLGAKFTALSDASMKEAEREEHRVELLFSGAHIQSVLKEHTEMDTDKRSNVEKSHEII